MLGVFVHVWSWLAAAAVTFENQIYLVGKYLFGGKFTPKQTVNLSCSLVQSTVIMTTDYLKHIPLPVHNTMSG